MEIYSSQYSVLMEVLAQKRRARRRTLAGIGITNQRETTIVWDQETGRPVYNAIVWQCRRTAAICATQLKAEGPVRTHARENTGLLIDAYFSGTKIKWILGQRARRARTGPQRARLLFGTVDTWLIWKLTGGRGACDRLHQRLPHHAVQHPTRCDWDEAICWNGWTSRSACCRRCATSSEIYGYA